MPPTYTIVGSTETRKTSTARSPPTPRLSRLDPKNAAAFFNRGLVYKAKGNLDAELADLTTAIAFDPKNAVIFFNRGLIHSTKRDFDEALADLKAHAPLATFALTHPNRRVG